jgi:hypothetical protein
MKMPEKAPQLRDILEKYKNTQEYFIAAGLAKYSGLNIKKLIDDYDYWVEFRHRTHYEIS